MPRCGPADATRSTLPLVPQATRSDGSVNSKREIEPRTHPALRDETGMQVSLDAASRQQLWMKLDIFKTSIACIHLTHGPSMQQKFRQDT